MSTSPIQTYTAFHSTTQIATGTLSDVAVAAKHVLDQDTWAPVLLFDDQTGRTVEVDYRGTTDDVRRRLESDVTRAPLPQPTEAAGDAPARGRGRPKLGVVAREITLLPRHWAWLAKQPSGASVALRKLVEEAMRANVDKDRVRETREIVYRVMSVLAGDAPGFEEATRALYAGRQEEFFARIGPWPLDVQHYLTRLSTAATAQ